MTTEHVMGQNLFKEQYLEIYTNDTWLEVPNDIFRSWTGPRRVNGSIYHGPVYALGSNKVIQPFKDPHV